ncbi:helix-turn-helix domain-containing protein [Streptomyces sp. NPDC059009]|uniref:helix-turn-helix domain-containing protein n=1 Tax=Streptomyces sp. NPDC059009 TaxID=3346694 RepID=UPI0036B8DBA1
MTSHAPHQSGSPDRAARIIPLRPATGPRRLTGKPSEEQAEKPPKEPLWRDLVGDVLRRERKAQKRTLKEVAEAARISMPYLSEVERGLKEASSEVLAAAAQALGLSLADLLGLVQGDLVSLAQARYDRRDRAAAPRTSVSRTSLSRTPLSRTSVSRTPVSRSRQGEVRLSLVA